MVLVAKNRQLLLLPLVRAKAMACLRHSLKRRRATRSRGAAHGAARGAARGAGHGTARGVGRGRRRHHRRRRQPRQRQSRWKGRGRRHHRHRLGKTVGTGWCPWLRRFRATTAASLMASIQHLRHRHQTLRRLKRLMQLWKWPWRADRCPLRRRCRHQPLLHRRHRRRGSDRQRLPSRSQSRCRCPNHRRCRLTQTAQPLQLPTGCRRVPASR